MYAIRSYYAYTLSGLTPGAQYAVFVDEVTALAGRFSNPILATLPGPEEFWNGASESSDPTIDDPLECQDPSRLGAFAEAHEVEGVVMQDERVGVITSYSIHYTKLYDGVVRGPAALDRRLSQIGVVPDRAAGQRLQAGLQPGQRLVTKEGDLWRGLRIRNATSFWWAIPWGWCCMACLRRLA